MQTGFSLQALADPHMRESEKILRTCVHCGFCTATCPTYLLAGDERDSPRGRIYLIKDMLEGGKPAPADVITHVDRCLSCLSCMTTCPSGVHYMHLADHARAYIEETGQRPLSDRFLRAMLAIILPYPWRFRLALAAGRMARPVLPLIRALPGVGERLAAMVALAPPQKKIAQSAPVSATELMQRRVALLSGCAQPVLQPSINAAATRMLARCGVTTITAPGEACCGALVHHMGREADALDFARKNVDAWTAEIEGQGLDAIIITASGCGTTIKDYGYMLREDAAYAEKAARVSALTRDITEYVAGLDWEPRPEHDKHERKLRLAYHSACSMQHGQKITDTPKTLLRKAGFLVLDVPESHICCGSAGVYNILQPAIAGKLRARKLANIARVQPQVVATGNIGCIAQLSAGSPVPVVHTIELLDWACGGPAPEGIITPA